MILFHAAEKVREQHKDLARLLTMEQGKPLREAIDEVRGYANILEYYAGISAQPAGEAIRLGAAGDALVVREPLGVCGAIIPWNMPVLIMGWKIGPALLAGNTMVLKPASTTPLTNLRLAAILDEAGLPPGVLNMVTGQWRGGRRGAGETPGGKKDLVHRELCHGQENPGTCIGARQGPHPGTRGFRPDDRDGRCRH